MWIFCLSSIWISSNWVNIWICLRSRTIWCKVLILLSKPTLQNHLTQLSKKLLQESDMPKTNIRISVLKFIYVPIIFVSIDCSHRNQWSCRLYVTGNHWPDLKLRRCRKNQKIHSHSENSKIIDFGHNT